MISSCKIMKIITTVFIRNKEAFNELEKTDINVDSSINETGQLFSFKFHESGFNYGFYSTRT